MSHMHMIECGLDAIARQQRQLFEAKGWHTAAGAEPIGSTRSVPAA